MTTARRTLQFVVVCEAAADQRTACTLADRVFSEEGIAPDPHGLEPTRAWCGIDAGSGFVTWTQVKTRFETERLRAHGHFNGEPGAPDAHAARRALTLVRHVLRSCEAVMLVRDSDNDKQRIVGLRQARDAFHASFAVAIAVAHTKRECWVISAFEPEGKHEQGAVKNLTKSLGFDPRVESHRLASRDSTDDRNPKHAIEILTNGEIAREQVGLQATPMAVLRKRGGDNGLTEFLSEVTDRLVPLFK